MAATTRPAYKNYIIPGILVLISLWIFGGYNGLVTQSEIVDNAWRQVETQYQRRFDLVPNLVQTVKGSANFEQSTYVAVTNARTQWQNAAGNRTQQLSAAQGLDGALSKFMVTVESYPQLKSTQAFQDLMTQLEGTENRIGVARKDFNDTVLDYNIRVRTFPGNILAAVFGYEIEEGFQSVAGSEQVPAVDFQ
jgi:LemA protein